MRKSVMMALVAASLVATPMLAQAPLFAVSNLGVYAGTTVGANSGQLLVGGKGDIGQFVLPQLRVIPEVAAAFGNTSSNTNVLGNLGIQADVVTLTVADKPFVVYGRAGYGVTWTQGVGSHWNTNYAYGFTFGETTKTKYFVEHQGLNKFKQSRIVVGISFK